MNVGDHPHLVWLRQAITADSASKALLQQMMPLAEKWNRQWHGVLKRTHHQLLGTQLKHPRRRDWYALIVADELIPDMYRAQYFDRSGFGAHATYEMPEQVLENLIVEGYCLVVEGVFETLSCTREWAIGLYKKDLVRRIHQGELSIAEAELLLRVYARQQS
ncbi:hypothetical protein EGJ52_25420 [Pseudomonas luteola]|nr:hypothetical protein EGJ52_25420 [Pseudomonas luteola]